MFNNSHNLTISQGKLGSPSKFVDKNKNLVLNGEMIAESKQDCPTQRISSYCMKSWQGLG